MPTSSVGRKLDLSKLTDEEARHVWDVVQRDLDLRRKEEDRLGELRSKVEEEESRRELRRRRRRRLAASGCVCCLQPFGFLLSVRRRCLGCRLHVCCSCSRFSRRERGWLCEACHLARVLKIGTLEWYHENLRARFKRFGSAKVMRSLCKRLSGEHSRSPSDATERPELDARSEPERHSGFEDLSLEAVDSPNLQMMKAKRRLTVDPVDFVFGFGFSANSRPQEVQASGAQDAMDPMLAEPDHLDLDMQNQPDEMSRTAASRSASRLSYSSCGSINLRGSSSFLPSLEDSEDDLCPQVPACRSHPDRGSHTSQESLSSAGAAPQISDLNKRMSAIETLLSCLEQKMTSANRKDVRTAQSPSPRPPQWDVEELEEQQLRLKLHRLTHDISDQSLSSEEDEAGRIPTRTRTGTRLEEDLKAERPLLEPPRTAALLLELEGRVAQAAADVQSAQSQVSYIEDRIAALSTAEGPAELSRRSVIPVRTRRLSHNVPSKPGTEGGLMKRRLSIM